ncbi:MAG: YcaO-like family protein [Alphaproteobacteria bacterium]|nr:YcaO-like family protein [Alphaproteobacteria bacterium]
MRPAIPGRPRDAARSSHRFGESLRACPPELTLARAKAWAAQARVRTVGDITHLDGLGLPVFVGERDGALTDGFTFGKGRVPIDAEIGAYMEAIENYFAEPGVAAIETRWGRADEIDLAEFAPILDHHCAPEAPLLLARSENAQGGANGWLPAELVFCPAPPGVERLFGASSNGLASGNSVAEASLHALFELIERDIWSTEFVRDRSRLVADLPDDARNVAEAAARGGLRLVLRHVPNDFAMPFFAAFLFDPAKAEARFFNGGWGCHLDKDVALMRAVSEVAQSRAAYLHGGRVWDGAEVDVAAQIETVSCGEGAVRFDDLAYPDAPGDIEAQWDAAVERLRRVTDRPIHRVVYTPQEGPLHVVRLVVPMLENFSREAMRVGPRLRAELEA